MQSKIVEILLGLNRQFYQTFALQFAQTRQRLQPGVQRFLPDLLLAASILDLGCGNGELARQLALRDYAGEYFGLDFSAELLAQAPLKLSSARNFHFFQADLSHTGWETGLPAESFERVVAFAVLHHLPGVDLRRQVVQRVHQHLHRGGRFILSAWQFLNGPRLHGRVQPWDRVGLQASQLDEGDYLLDWRHGGTGLRYVHLLPQDELNALAFETSFSVEDAFFSDGENNLLGLYQVWRPV